MEMLEELSTPVFALATQWHLVHLKMNCIPAPFSPSASAKGDDGNDNAAIR